MNVDKFLLCFIKITLDLHQFWGKVLSTFQKMNVDKFFLKYF